MRTGQHHIIAVILITLGGLAQNAWGEDVYHVAARAYRAGEWQAALDGFQSVIDAKENADRQQLATYFAAECLVQLNQPDKAIPKYREIIEATPHHRYFRQSSFRIGEAELLAGNPRAAVELLTKFEKQYPRDELRSFALYDLGRAKMALHDYPGAIDEFQRWIQEFSKNAKLADVRAALTDAFVAAARYEEALQTVESSIRDTPPENPQIVALRNQRLLMLARLGRWEEINAEREAPEVLSVTWRGVVAGDLAEMAYAAGNWKYAKELFQELVEHGEDDQQTARGLSGVAWCQLQLDDLSTAAETFANLLARSPGEPLASEASLARGHVLERLQQYDSAIECYQWVEKNCEQTERRAEGLWRLAKLYQLAEQFSDALKAYHELAELKQEAVAEDEIHYRICLTYEESEQANLAEKELSLLSEKFPRSPWLARLALQRASQAAARQKFAQAESTLTQVSLRNVPEDLVVPYSILLGKARVLAGKPGEAIAPLDRALSVETIPANQLAAQFWRAEADYQLGNDQEVLKRVAVLAHLAEGRREPWLAIIPLRKAQCELRQEDYEAALGTAQQLLKDHPDFNLRHEAELVIGRVLASRGEMGEARATYRKVIEHAPSSAGATAALAQWLIGETYFHQEEFAAALEEYREVPSHGKSEHWEAAAILQSGKCCERLGDFARADEYYSQLMQSYPDSPFAADAQGRHQVASRMITRQ